MKNAGKHADTFKSLAKKLVKEVDIPPRTKLDPLQALVRGSLSFDVPDELVDDAMQRISEEFVDLNELRVATELEVADLLGERFPRIDERASIIRQALNTIFEKEHTLKLDRLADLKKAEIRQYLRELPGMTPFVEAFVTLMAFDSSAVPVDDTIIDFLVDEEVLDEAIDAEEVQQFVESNVKADDSYDVFQALRIRSLASDSKKKAKKK